MKALVGYKRVVDPNVRIMLKPDSSGVAVEGTKQSANPFDEIALEEALRLREAGIVTEVVLATIGPPDWQAQIRTGLAMGADRALHVVTDALPQPLDAARILLRLVEREAPNLVLLGKQAIDDDANQTGQMLAALWDRPQATFASKVEINGGVARVTREIDAGMEVLEVDLPAVITADLRLNVPRFVKLPDILRAKSKPLTTVTLGELGITLAAGARIVQFAAPKKRHKGVVLKDVGELVAILKSKGLVADRQH